MLKTVRYIIFIICLCGLHPVFAATQWMTMLELPMITYQIDKETARITGPDDNRQLDLWLKMVEKAKDGAYSINHYIINERDLSFVLKERTFYKSDGAEINTYKNPVETWNATTKNSPVGDIASRIFSEAQYDQGSGKRMVESTVEVQKTAQQYLEEGKTAFAIKDYDKAIIAYSRAVEKNPKLGEALIGRGQAYLMSKQFALAQSDFSTAMVLNPKNEVLYWLLGLAYAGQEKHQLAIDAYNKALRINPKMYIAYWDVALSQEKLGMRYLARQAYAGYLQYAPPDDAFVDKAKNRLVVLESMDKNGAESASKIVADKDANTITLDYLSKDYLTVTFDKSRWKLGYKEYGKNIIAEFVTGKETVQSWTELITVQLVGASQNSSPQRYAEFLEKRYRDEFGEKMVFSILRNTEADVIVEYRVSGQPGVADEHTITRIFKGAASLAFVHYAVKPCMTPEQRNIGLHIIEGVRLSSPSELFLK